VITTRLDRLDEITKHILQAASVIGREFSVDILTRMVEIPESLPDSLETLRRRELVREKGSRQYSFKHALTQETAYQSILLSNRRELHRRGAEALVALGTDAPGEIARHLLEARLPARALPYLVQAGDRAARSYATPEAIGYYRQALETRSVLVDLELLRQAYEGLGNALSFANQIPEAQAAYLEMLAQAEASGNVPMQISALNKLGGITGLRLGRFAEAEVFLARSEKLSREHAEKSGIPEMALIRCQMCTAQADFEGVITHMDEVVHIGQETGSREHLMLGLEHVSTSLVYLARFAEAQEKALKALTLAREVGNREEEAWLLGFALALISLSQGNIEGARASLTEGLQIATKIGSLLPQITSAYLLGEIARWQGDYERALSFGHRSLEAASPLEAYMPFMVVPSLGSLGMTYLEISEKFTDKIGEFHLHALRLLEDPAGTAAGGTAWADLGLCALTLGDMKIAEAMIEKGLNHPNMFMRLERPRHLAGAALLCSARGEHDRACRLAEEARNYAEEHRIRYHLPFTSLIQGKLLAIKGENRRSLDALERAETEALGLGFRSIIWQARLVAADVYNASGEANSATQQRGAAQDMASEIAGLFIDENLRQAYLQTLKIKGLFS
jgi:tetratricopeptide (TPR) repeat protein